ncbi:PREDICTED: uncharacterized protein LOC105568371 [Vollenhovia emeryi]|uniref:uncharacterized protein LOC105568371 n=1 Tax=Vollenhovia emeryi TaxID=411798 RepID=UPI0005F41EBB|nr:PREDICTED: uncharacterized protein LOC105568371 [Vollenhovia emeryi]
MCERTTATVRKKLHYHDAIREFRIQDNILTGKEVPINKEPINISEVLLKTLKSKPNCIGQIDTCSGKQDTYADMSERSIKCALWLQKQGIKPGDIIGLCCDNDMDGITIILGTMYISAISNPWEYELSPMTARYFLSLTSPKIIFAIPSAVPCLEEAVKELKINLKIVVFHKLNGYECVEDILRGHDICEITEFKCTKISSPSDVALIALSSGTTGMPKGTEISHSSLYNCLHSAKVTELEGHTCLWTPTFRWHYGVQLAFHAILAYATKILLPCSLVHNDDDETMCKLIEKYQVTWLCTDPGILTRLSKSDLLENYPLLTLKEVMNTGAHFKKKHHLALAKKLPHAFVTNTYGATDSGGDITVGVRNCKAGSAGFVAPNVQLKVFDVETGKALEANQNGELRCKLPCVMNGYYKRPEETKRAFDSDGWLCTGDIGYYDDDGNVFIVDRISEFLIIHSLNISTAEIEYVLEFHPAISQVAVIGIPHEIAGEYPMAVVSCIPGKTATEEELHDLVAKNLPAHCKLQEIKFLDKLPRTATGKIAKKQLRDMFKVIKDLITPILLHIAYDCDSAITKVGTKKEQLIITRFIKMCERTIATVSKKLHYHDAIREFRIQDNILIGQEVPINKEPINISEVLLKTLKSKPNCIGQIDAFSGKQDTYADMSERSIKCALWLKKQGIKPGDIIGLCCDNEMDGITILLGTLYISAISNPWDYDLSPMTARYFLSLTSPKIVFAMPSAVPSLEEAVKELKINLKIVVFRKLSGYESVEDILRGQDTCEITEFKCTKISSPSDVALIALSSGTTGMPKGTEISHSSLYNCLLPVKVTELEGHTCLWSPTLRWHYGVQLAFHAILAYATKILSPCSVIINNDDETMCKFIEKYQVTWFCTEPGMLTRFSKSDLLEKYPLLTLKEVMNTGAHFKKEHHLALAKKLPHAFITNAYGSTDSGGDITVVVRDCKVGSVGFVAPNVQIKVVDVETGKVLGANQNGELRCKSPCVMNGYYKRPEETKQAFDSDGWLCTGDIGYYDDDGNVFIVDRISEFLLFYGINISTAEIEYVLEFHPALSQVAVIGIPHETAGEYPMAVVSCIPGKTATEEELNDLVAKNLPAYCELKGGIKFLDKLPRTATGKIAKKQLRNMFAN